MQLRHGFLNPLHLFHRGSKHALAFVCKFDGFSLPHTFRIACNMLYSKQSVAAATLTIQTSGRATGSIRGESPSQCRQTEIEYRNLSYADAVAAVGATLCGTRFRFSLCRRLSIPNRLESVQHERKGYRRWRTGGTSRYVVVRLFRPA